MNNSYLINTVRFVLLVLVQVLVFNRLNLFGFINPMVYILFIYWFPIKENRALFIGLSFLIGLTIDIFSDTLAFHAASTVTIAYIRPAIMRFVFGVNIEFQSFRLSSSTKAQQITFLALLIIVHHLVFFGLEIFSFANILVILKKVLAIGSVSMILCLLFNTLFSTRKE
mgnify:CR=1 FL=1|tara:strand:+ start:2401 stop:2907 length:507 start_codon:yes stop_codon:yes gene_type:complete